MNIVSLAKHLVIIPFLIIVIIFLSLPAQIVLAQQPAPFLVTPYYGTKAITSIFDHEYPNYGIDDTLVGYNGVRRGPPAAVNNCTNGLNGSCYNGHDGVDFAMSYEPVVAAAAGIVLQASWESPNCRTCGFGLRVEIRHTNNSNYVTRYSHLSSTTVVPGQSVLAGQVIGTSGNTGSSTGAHLHFGVLNSNNLRIDPFGWTGSYSDPWQQSSGAVSSCLWKDGEWANYCGGVSRPIPLLRTSGEITLDDTTNNSGGFNKGRSGPFNISCPPDSCPDWNPVSSGGFNNDRYWTYVNGSTADYWALWLPSISSNNQGWYEVQAYIPASDATTWQAKYQVRHNGGQASITLDQLGSGNRWISLGVYQLTPGNAYVSVTDATGSESGHCSGACKVSVDAIRFVRLATYLPDIRSATSDGWDSAFYIRNDGAGPTDISLNMLNENGTSAETFTYTNLAAHARLYYNPVITGWDGAVVVDSRQPVSVEVTHQDLSPFRAAAYTGVNQPTTEVHIPLLYKNNTAWTSSLYIQNTRNASANVMMTFSVGGTGCPQSYTVPAYGQVAVSLVSISCIGSSFAGSARLTSNQPIAVAPSTRNSAYTLLMETSNATGPAASAAYLPRILNEKTPNGWTSGLGLQNVSANVRTLNATYYNSNGTGCISSSYPNLSPYFSHLLNPPFTLSCSDITNTATLTSTLTSTDKTMAMLHQIKPDANYAAAYMSIPTPSKTISLPYWFKGSGWSSRLSVYNPNNSSTSVTVRYYNPDGSLSSSESLSLVAHGLAYISNTPSVSTFSGSALIIANLPVTAVVNQSLSNSSGDALMIYEGMHY